MENYYKILEEKLGFKIKEYRNKWYRAGKNNYIPNYPLHLNLELTFGCNLKCEFCICRKNKTRKGFISFDKYCDIIDEGIENGLYSIELNGINEPLLQKNIDKYIKYAKDSGILSISLHTNSILLDEKMSNKLINNGLTLLIFSVDAFKKETYEKIREGATYEIMINNINNFLHMKKRLNVDFPLTKVSFVKNKVNFNEFTEFVNFWKSKVDFISESYFCNPFVGEKEYAIIEKKYRLENYDLGLCLEPFRRLLISNNGDIFPCCSFFGIEMLIGNVYKDSIKNVWNSNKMKKIRELVNSSEDKQYKFCIKCRKSMMGDII